MQGSVVQEDEGIIPTIKVESVISQIRCGLMMWREATGALF